MCNKNEKIKIAIMKIAYVLVAILITVHAFYIRKG